jgi:hypothetical protein
MEGVTSFVAALGPPLIDTLGAEMSTVRTCVAVPMFCDASVIDASTS